MGRTSNNILLPIIAAIGKKGYDHVWRERMLEVQKVIEGGETDLMRGSIPCPLP